MGGIRIFAERSMRMKSVSSLIRYGFTTDEIREALRSIAEEDED